MKTRLMHFTVCALLGFYGFSSHAQETVRPSTYSPHGAKRQCNMNMGPTGAAAWMRGYSLVVMSIDERSPAHTKLMLGDTVTAADGKEFGPNADPRIVLGNAIGRAEADGKPLVLTVIRAKKKLDVAITLPKLGAYSATWPAKCQKSEEILDAACRSLVQAQLPNGDIVTDGSMGTYLGGLLLLGSGNPKYLDAARRAAYWVNEQGHWKSSLNNWNAAYGGVLLAEYYLATGDDSALAGLQSRCDQLAKGQMRSGGWGHTTPHGAYGTLNQVGVICTLALVLADECGVKVDQAVKKKALDFFARFAERGAVPYGDHFPYMGSFDANGRNASCAIAMHLAGRTKEAEALATAVSMSYWEREEGHTGGFFSMSWGPLAAAMMDTEKFRTFMDYQKWHYNLLRNWKGELLHLPYHEALTRFDDSAYIDFGGDFTTGGFGLAYALPQKRLRITGAPKSVFSPKSKPTGTLALIRKHYLAREWKACDSALAEFGKRSRRTAEQHHWYKQLRSARALHNASTDRTLLEVESNILEGAPYWASEQFTALKRATGTEVDPRFETVEKQLAGQAYGIGEGKKFYEIWGKLRVRAFMGWTPQGKVARQIITGLPTLRKPLWEPLSAVSKVAPQKWHSILLGGHPLPKSWNKVEFDDSKWTEFDGIKTMYKAKKGEKLPNGRIAARRIFEVDDPKGVQLKVHLQTVRPALTRVYLNGTLIVNAVRGQRGGYASIPLDKSVFKALRKGKNVLAVTCDKQGAGGNHLDVGLYICRESIETMKVPTLRQIAPPTLAIDDDSAMRVRETKDKKKRALHAAIAAKDIPGLIKDLERPVGAYRHTVEGVLARKGLAGLKAVVPLAQAKDWKQRSAYSSVVGSVANLGRRKEKPGDPNALKQADKDAMVAAADQQIPTLVKLLDDENFWVRWRTVNALSSSGEKARVALPKLTKMISDPDPWVRYSVVAALDRLQPDPEVLVATVVEALKIPSTAYNLPRRSLGILKKHPKITTGKLDAVVAVLRTPPQGSGGRTLKPYMEYGKSLDPEGKVMVQVLVDGIVNEPGFGQQQANPRNSAVEILISYGDKAKPAIPTLKKVLLDEEKKGLHKYAIKALEGLGVTDYPKPVEEKK